MKLHELIRNKLMKKGLTVNLTIMNIFQKRWNIRITTFYSSSLKRFLKANNVSIFKLIKHKPKQKCWSILKHSAKRRNCYKDTETYLTSPKCELYINMFAHNIRLKLDFLKEKRGV